MVYFPAEFKGAVIRKELASYQLQNHISDFIALVRQREILGEVAQVVSVRSLGSKSQNRATARCDLTDGGEGRGIPVMSGFVGGQESDAVEVGFDETDGAMLEETGADSFGVPVGDFLEFQADSQATG